MRIKNPLKLLLLITILLGIFKFTLVNLNGENEEHIIIDNSNNSVSNDLSSKKALLEQLNSLVTKDKRVKQIINNYNDYPEQLLDMLVRNIEMIDYVLDFPKEKGKTYGDTIGDFQGTIPKLLQWDKRWGYAPYGENYVGISGCGPTALSMVIMGLTRDFSMTPYKVAKFALENGYYINGVGTSWSLMTEGAKSLGINSQEIPLSKTIIYNALKKGHPIICSMKKGDFTTKGHFIVLVDVVDDEIKLNDPNSIKRSEILWTYEQLAPQIKNLWEFFL